jgi:type III pantothenate kinase
MNAVAASETVIALDVGNTRVGMAVWDDGGLHDSCRVSTLRPAEWRPALESTLSHTRHADRRAVVIGSICPEATVELARLATDVCGVEPLHVRDDLPLPMPLDIENPNEVGVDRVCAAAAAYDRIQAACAVASFGTATTVDCVSPDGHFLGGAILPGMEMSCDALHDHTALLPRVCPGSPNGTFGKNTHDAIMNGVTLGAIGALREIVERFATELRQWPPLVITGGNAPIVGQLAEFVDAVVPDLCLMGIALAYRQAAAQP